MNPIKKIISFTLSLILIVSFISFNVGALFDKENATEKFYSYETKLLCISHRGDTALYPENSLEGIKSALKKGADFVSVNIEKTADGVFYLCEDESLGNICNAPYDSLSQMNSDEVDKYRLFDIFGKETKYKLVSLESLLDRTDSEDGIILDVKTADKDAVYGILKENKSLDRIILRVVESGSKLTEWAESKPEKVYVIGKYTGNIIFSTVSYINALTSAKMPAVQFESKNYFNVSFGEFFTKRYLKSENVRAIAATYSPDLCGQREDNADGWNELINKNYSVIETNNIDSFISYRNETERLSDDLRELYDGASLMERDRYSQVSLTNLDKATALCEEVISDDVVSLAELQKAYSKLDFALKEMKISTGEVDTRGALNITAGKVIAAVLVGAALLAGQIYVYKMRRSKKENK
ncbi:MAG: glycerophosphodiester phosphodiesterase family protein [Ruminococcaceae bacterium]|nr:glycerophosphodiester phosphodiesterase family protein [Oscillospiraceae bacterium]